MSHDAAAMHLLWRAVRSDVPARELGAFRSTGRLAVPAAIGVYKTAYWVRQHAALRDLFPRLSARLGEAGFRELVRRYLLARPSTHPELEHLGAGLAAYLRGEPALAHLAQLAELEHAHVESFLAPDSPAATFADIDPVRFGAARLELAASLRIVLADGVLLQLLAHEGGRVLGAAAIVVSRPRFATVTHPIAADELALLRLVQGGASIQDLLAYVGDDVAGLHVPLQQWFLRRWIATIATDVP